MARRRGKARDGESDRSRRRRRFLRIGFQIASVAAIAFFFYRQRHLFKGFGPTMARLAWTWVGVALLAELGSIPPLAEEQLLLLRAAGTRANRWQMNLVTLASNAIALSVPAGVAVAEGYAYARYRRFGANAATAAWAELASGAIAFAALAGVALAGSLVAGGSLERILVPLLSVVFAGAVGAAALFRHPHVIVRALDWIAAHLGQRLGDLIGRTTRRIRDTSHKLSDLHPSVATWASAFGLSALNWLLDVLCLALCFRAVEAPIPWGAVLLAFAGAKVVTSIGITPGGLGIVEGGLVATFVAYGSTGTDAVAAVILYRALTLIGLVGIGWVVAGVMAIERPRRAR